MPLRVRVTSSSSHASALRRGGAEHRLRDGPAEAVDGLDPVLDCGDRFLQRGRPVDEPHRAGGGHALGQRRGEALGERVGVDGLGELDVEVLGVALVADRERQPEADLRAGARTPAVNASGSSLDAERALEARGRRRGAR